MVSCIAAILSFKQKTSYQMRISDLSSDVFSSDLIDATFLQQLHGFLKYRKGLETQKIKLYQSCPFNIFHVELSDGHIGAWVAIEWHQVRRSEEHTSELQSLMRISYAVFCLKKKMIHPSTV